MDLIPIHLASHGRWVQKGQYFCFLSWKSVDNLNFTAESMGDYVLKTTGWPVFSCLIHYLKYVPSCPRIGHRTIVIAITLFYTLVLVSVIRKRLCVVASQIRCVRDRGKTHYPIMYNRIIGFLDIHTVSDAVISKMCYLFWKYIRTSMKT